MGIPNSTYRRCYSEQEIKNATNVSTRRTERGAGEGQLQARTEVRDTGFTPKERRAFLLRGALRSYRLSNAAAQPYTRASNRGTRRLRVLTNTSRVHCSKNFPHIYRKPSPGI